MPSAKLTTANIGKLPIPARGRQVIWRDTALRGFGVRITPRVRSWIVERSVKGRSVRATIGECDLMDIATARQRAREWLGKVAGGVDPRIEKRHQEGAAVTLAQAFDACMTSKRLRPASLRAYRQVMSRALGDWQTKPLALITKDMVVDRHLKLTNEHGAAYATLTMRCLSSVFTFAEGAYEDGDGESLFPQNRNPVRRLAQLKLWHSIPRRQGVIRESDLPRWYEAVDALRTSGSPFNETIADYLLLVLMTGLRRTEAAGLQWRDISFSDATLTITADKAKNGHTHVLPIGPHLRDLLQRRQRAGQGPWVFPNSPGTGPLRDARYVAQQVIEESGVKFTTHDLRRTFAVTAERIKDISAYAIKRLLNHVNSPDVTQGYLVLDVERLREPMTKIEKYFIRAMGIAESNATSIAKVQE